MKTIITSLILILTLNHLALSQNSYPGTGPVQLTLNSDDRPIILKDGRSGINWNYIEWQFSDGSRDWILGRRTGTGSFTLFRQGIQDVLTANNNGNIGIGTPSPQWKLDVAGLIASNGQAIVNVLANEINIGDVAGGDGYRDNLYFSTHDQKRVIIDGSGNMGIGTLSPNKKLTVNGTIYGKEVEIDLNVPGPDYVFEKDYKLPSLEEIKSYIDEHRHLPEVPSAKEMEANGINVGEMNMILLKKVEELTLHLIEQNKKLQEMDDLKKEIQDLKSKIH